MPQFAGREPDLLAVAGNRAEYHAMPREAVDTMEAIVEEDRRAQQQREERLGSAAAGLPLALGISRVPAGTWTPSGWPGRIPIRRESR